MILSVGPLLSELSASAETSPVDRLMPFVLLAFGILVVVAIVLGLKHLGASPEDNDRQSDD